MLPAVIAADRAVIFSGGVLVVYAILLMPHLHPFATNSPPRRITIAQFVLVWTASFIPMFVIPPEMDSDTSSLPKYFPCLETDSACHSGRRLVQTYVFLSQTFPAMAITMFTQYWRFYSEFNPRTFFLLFGIFGLAMSALVILFNTPNWHRGVAWGLPIGIITTFLIPAVLGILTILSFFLVMYPMVCAFEFGTILVLAAIPRSGVFPHSGISMGEVDQIGSLLIVVVYHSIHGMSNGVTKIWKRLRQREPRQEEELPLSGA
ncbi:hypothetical protein DL96DRAFT_1617522 [Flagelloscypha sp. PMI_526]|nr:hypothetical protein DL96DRAFT_1617522 [Flagelloscypha sp. PMI_526]